MSQQDIFKKAIAAKLAGDEEGFKSAISEAIKAKTKALIVESRPQYVPPNIEQHDSNWFGIPEVNLPEGNAAQVPAGVYELGVGTEPASDSDSAFANFTEVQVFNEEGDSIATLHGDDADAFVQQYVPRNAQEVMHDRAGEQYMKQAQEYNDDAMADAGAEAKWSRDNGMDGY